ncbi:MAG: hypothetical protein MUE94_10515 [Verrucomicrobia bacterium]|jgi:hypothetical protein|nr:hypothetical protein [Verrucomicrobiota bacterium]
MKLLTQLILASLLCGGVLQGHAETSQTASSNVLRETGIQAAQTASTVTGLAISPLVGVGAVGAYQWWNAPQEQRAHLHWFARPWFWIPALLLAGAVAAKDIVGTAAPTALKKPFDVAEAVENKVSGLVVAGAVVPLVTTIFPDSTQTASLASAGFAAIDLAGIGNAFFVPFAIAAFVIVWLASHAINILILISPFTTVDTALKAFRLTLLGLVTGTSFSSPLVGALISAILLLIAFFIAGWSFRLLVFGNLYVWDFVTLRRKRFHPFRDGNRMFTARKINRVPVRTYGWLNRAEGGKLEFHYRPWLVMPRQMLPLPAGTYVVGRGLFHPEIAREQGDDLEALMTLPPRYRTHEQELNDVYGLAGVRDVGIRRCLKAILEVFGLGKREQAVPA